MGKDQETVRMATQNERIFDSVVSKVVGAACGTLPSDDPKSIAHEWLYCRMGSKRGNSKYQTVHYTTESENTANGRSKEWIKNFGRAPSSNSSISELPDDFYQDLEDLTKSGERLKTKDNRNQSKNHKKTEPHGPPHDVMTVKVSRIVPAEREPFRLMYPYDRLKESCLAYRGYPIDGGDSMKRNRHWKIQIAPPALGPPPEPLPAFPEIACLRSKRDGSYSLNNRMSLTERQLICNSGVAWLHKDSNPKCKYFYAAGQRSGSPVKVNIEGVGGSIYKAVHCNEVDMFANYPSAESQYSSSLLNSRSTLESERD